VEPRPLLRLVGVEVDRALDDHRLQAQRIAAERPSHRERHLEQAKKLRRLGRVLGLRLQRDGQIVEELNAAEVDDEAQSLLEITLEPERVLAELDRALPDRLQEPRGRAYDYAAEDARGQSHGLKLQPPALEEFELDLPLEVAAPLDRHGGDAFEVVDIVQLHSKGTASPMVGSPDVIMKQLLEKSFRDRFCLIVG
jgi:hypothetical protein